MKRLLISLLITPLLLTCGSAPPATRLLPKSQAGGHLLWQRNEIALEQTLNLKFENMVMVSYPRNGRLAAFAQNHQQDILTTYADPTNDMQHSLIVADSSAALDHIAALAHSADGFACGNVELIRPEFAFQATSNDTRYAPIYPEITNYPAVATLLNSVDSNKIATTMQSLVALGTRHHEVNPGATASTKALMTAATSGSAFTFAEDDHPNTTQKSIIASLPATTLDAQQEEIVIVGAHLDSINPSDNNNAPGADDNASGIAVLTEVMRIIAANNLGFARRVEFHAYAAEEALLVGSQDIAAAYKAAGKKVVGMLQLDMTAYSAQVNDETIYVVETDTSNNLQRSLKDLLHTYLGGNFKTSKLSGGTSDHKAWTNQGYAAIFPFENPSAYNHNLHTSDDTLANAANKGLAARFAKLVLAYVAHQAGLTTLSTSSALVDKAYAALGKKAPLAIIKTGGATSYKPIVAMGSNIAHAELCTVASNTATGCDSERYKLTALGTKNDKALFIVDQTVTIKDQSRWRIFGYDSNEKLVDQRTVQLSKK